MYLTTFSMPMYMYINADVYVYVKGKKKSTIGQQFLPEGAMK